MSSRVKGFIILAFILCIILFANRYFYTTYHSIATSGLVTNKQSSPLSITLKTLGETSSENKVIRILIKDENVWNLIEVNRYYFVNYSWKNNEIPSLSQIMINDEFGEIYNNKFNN